MTKAYEIHEDEHGIGDVLIPRVWDESVERLVLRKRIQALRLSYSMGFRGSDVGFVSRLTLLRSLEVYSFDVTDLRPIATLPKLEVIGVEVERTKAVDFSGLGSLRVAMLRWVPGLEGVLKRPTLHHLNVVNYPFIDLEPLAELPSLRVLKLTSRKLTTLDGIDALGSLQALDLYNCPGLQSLGPAKQLPCLRRIEVEACRHIGKGRIVDERDV